MIDRMSFQAPLGVLGRFVDVVLAAYLRRPLRERAAHVKALAETT
jgi:hypothetical protein